MNNLACICGGTVEALAAVTLTAGAATATAAIHRGVKPMLNLYRKWRNRRRTARRLESLIIRDTLVRRIIDAGSGAEYTLRIVADQHGAAIELIGVARSIVVDLANGELRVFPVNEFGDVTEAAALSIQVAPLGLAHVDA